MELSSLDWWKNVLLLMKMGKAPSNSYEWADLGSTLQLKSIESIVIHSIE